MNPFNNRWIALFVVVGVLLMAAELVGTGENGGVLSRTAQSLASRSETVPENSSSEDSSERPLIIDEVPEEDLPQLVSADEAVDDDEVDVDDFSAPDVVFEDPSEYESSEE